MSAPDQQSLIEQARAGSTDAFATLVTLNQDRLYRFLLSRCQAKADAEDAMQEAFISAFRYLDSYNPRWAFSTWLYRIALRELGKLRRRNEGAAGPPARAAEQAEDPLAACIAESQRENLWLTARATLSEQAFTAMWLRYAEDMPLSDVARVMGRPAVWVRVTVHRARRRLASCLAVKDCAPGTAAPGDRRDVTAGRKSKGAKPEAARSESIVAALNEHTP